MKMNFGKSFAGILLITLGVLYLLTNIGLIPLGIREVVTTYWPVVIILWAAYRLVEGLLVKENRRRKFNRVYWSLGLMVIGGVLLENRVQYFTVESIGLWSIVFSIFIIYVGLSIVFFKSNGIEFNFDGTEEEKIWEDHYKGDPSEAGEVFNGQKDSNSQAYENKGCSKDELKERMKEKHGEKKSKIEEKYTKDHKNYGYKSKDKQRKNSKTYTFDDLKASKDRFHFVGEIRLGDQPWALENSSYSLGVGEVYMDLTTALLEEGVTYVNLSGWVGSVQIIVPEDLAIDVSADVNIGSVEIFGEEQEFSRHHKNRRSGVSSNLLCYRSEDYDKALKKVRINASVNIGEVSLKRVG
jgi:lia operon protein LiaF